jgi:hypothetical protein
MIDSAVIRALLQTMDRLERSYPYCYDWSLPFNHYLDSDEIFIAGGVFQISKDVFQQLRQHDLIKCINDNPIFETWEMTRKGFWLVANLWMYHRTDHSSAVYQVGTNRVIFPSADREMKHESSLEYLFEPRE